LLGNPGYFEFDKPQRTEDYAKFDKVMKTIHKKKDIADILVDKNILGNSCRSGTKNLEVLYQCFYSGDYGKIINVSGVMKAKGEEGEKIRLDCKNHIN